jgi:hypothetical protein
MRRRHFTEAQQVTTIQAWIRKRQMTQRAFSQWMEANGIACTPQYLNDILTGKRNPGPVFKKLFWQIEGIRLVDGLVEHKEGVDERR